MQKLRLITFNIAHGRGLSPYQGFHSTRYIENILRKITKLLTEADVDIVALQEVDEGSYWNKNINLIEVIRKETPYHHGFFGINNQRGGRKNLNYGNAFLSRYPVHSHHTQPFSIEQIGGKGFMYAEFEVKNQRIPVINLHLDFRSKLRRKQQVDQIIAYLENKPCDGNALLPIICGDFNCTAQRTGDAAQYLFDYLEREKNYSLLPDGTHTFPAHFPATAIDFIFMPHEYKILHVEVPKVYLSDHRPVLIEFANQARRE
ncbi:MAG: endonuclease/exonuclease/phosphatase family protein [Pseudomonadales bacterium]|nr:endonuclease/exonuclease/phosphatase family protein [Pseudomonadales bacterium]